MHGRTRHPSAHASGRSAALTSGRTAPLRALARGVRRTVLGTVATVTALLLVGTVASGARAVAMPVRVAGGATVGDEPVAAVDYPFDRSRAPFDEYGFVAGECTSFAAWWLNRHGVPFGVVTVGPQGTGRFLNATTWDGAARSAGWQVGDRPVVGAVAHWRAGESSPRVRPDGAAARFVAGRPGHVAVVTKVYPDGTAQWVERGWGGLDRVHVGRGTAPRYLYVGVTPPA